MGLSINVALSTKYTDRTKEMEIFRWVKGMLLGVVLIITFRLFAEGLGWSGASLVASYLGAILVCVGAVLAIIGTILDRRNTLARRLGHSAARSRRRA